MRIILLHTIVFLSLLFTNSLAQMPYGITYQGVVRNTSGELQANQMVEIQMSILLGSASGDVVYQERFTTQTNALGLLNVVIGTGNPSPISPVFNLSDVDWSLGLHFLKVELDLGSGFQSLGVTKFVSVPYAFVADTVLNSGIENTRLEDLKDVNTSGISEDNVLAWNGSEWVKASKINIEEIEADFMTSQGLLSDNIQASEISSQNVISDQGYITVFNAQNASLDTIQSVSVSTDELTVLSNFSAPSIQTNALQTNTLNANQIDVLTLEAQQTITSPQIQSTNLSTNDLEAETIEAEQISSSAIETQSLIIHSALSVSTLNADSVMASYGNIVELFSEQLFAGQGLFEEVSIAQAEIEELTVNQISANQAEITSIDATIVRADSVVADYFNIDLSGLSFDPDSLELEYLSASEIVMPSVQIGASGTPILGMYKWAIQTDLPEIEPEVFYTHEFEVPGASPGMSVSVTPQKDLGKVILTSHYIKATNKVVVNFYNPTKEKQDPIPMEFDFLLVQ